LGFIILIFLFCMGFCAGAAGSLPGGSGVNSFFFRFCGVPFMRAYFLYFASYVVCLPACLLALLVCSIAALSAFLLQLLFCLTFFFLSIRLGE
jgi:hypothetical protein